MNSPARQHWQRTTAAKAAVASAGTTMHGDAHELMAATLWEHRRTLKAIKSTQKKIETKASMLPDYDAYVQGVLEAGQGAQDDVLMTVMVWHFDVGNLQIGLNIAEYALSHGLATPDRFKRDTASIVAEQTAEAVLDSLDYDDGHVLEHMRASAARAMDLTRSFDMHDQIRAKLHKALGYAERACGDLDDALASLRAALELDDKAGVKKDIEHLERDLRKQQNAA